MTKSPGILVVLFLLPFFAGAQPKRLSFSAGSGLMYYQGDLTVDRLPQKKQLYPYLYLATNYRLTNTFSASFGFLKGKVGAADSLTSRKNDRDFHFVSPVNDFHLLLGINLKEIWRSIRRDNGIRKRFDHHEVLNGPKIMIGGGYFNFNPSAKYNGTWNKLRSLGTEGQYIEGGNYPDPYKLWQFNLKLGGEVGFWLDRHWQLELYGAYTYLFTDYLDDVSGDFPDYNELILAPRGKLASRYTYRFKDGHVAAKGLPRGNPDIRDSYLNLGIKVTYSFSRAQLDGIRP